MDAGNENIKRGDIYYADLGIGQGSEQKGVRPVLVIQNNVGNKFSPTIIIAAITSQLNKANIPTHVDLSLSSCNLPKNSTVLLEQIRTIDKKRLGAKLGKLDDNTMSLIDKSSKISIGLLEVKSDNGRFNEDYITERQYKISRLNILISKYKSVQFDTMIQEYERIVVMGEIITYCNSFNRDPKHYLENNKTEYNNTYNKIAI